MVVSMHQRRGMTRAEILVVIAITAVLAAMGISALLPRSSAARAQAELALCRQNLQKIGAGTILYAASNNGSLPVSETVDGPHSELLQALLPGYIADRKLFYCPSAQQPELRYDKANFGRGVIGYFYYNAARASTNQQLSKFLLSGVSWPRALDAGSDKNSWVMSDAWFSGEPTAHSSYKKGVNYLELGGTVDFVAESPRQSFH